MKALVGTFNQEKALVGSPINRFAALNRCFRVDSEGEHYRVWVGGYSGMCEHNLAGCGNDGVEAMRVTASPHTTGTSSPPWMSTMTRCVDNVDNVDNDVNASKLNSHNETGAQMLPMCPCLWRRLVVLQANY